MRDPVERAISHYWHMVANHAETRRMLEAVQRDPTFISYSHYALQLRAYLDVVERDRVFVLTLEGLVANPRPQLRSLYGWLGIDPDYVPAILGQPVNATPAVVFRARGLGVLQRLRDSALASRIGPYVPQSMRSFLASLAAAPIARQSISVDDAVDYLRPLQQAQTAELGRLLQRDFPEWTTLWGSRAAADQPTAVPIRPGLA